MSGPSYFYEDEVCRTNKSGEIEFGMVMENWEMYSSEDEDDSDPSRVPRGFVSVNWHPKGKEETIQESKVRLSDRSLMPGDVVCKLDNANTQRGYCRAVKVLAAVQILGTKKVIPNVLATNVRPVHKLQPDVAVYLDSWVGVIRDIRNTLTLRFVDNSQCTIEDRRLHHHFEDTRRNDGGFNNSDIFYPGQRLRGAMKYLKDAKWSNCSEDLKRAKDRKMVTVTVVKIEPTAVSVQWQWQAPGGTDSNNRLGPPSPGLVSFVETGLNTILNGLDGHKLKHQQRILQYMACPQPTQPSVAEVATENTTTVVTDNSTHSAATSGTHFDIDLGSEVSLSLTTDILDTAEILSTVETTGASPSALSEEKVQPELKTKLETSSSSTHEVSDKKAIKEEIHKILVESASALVAAASGTPGVSGPESSKTQPAHHPIHPPEFVSGERLKNLKCLNLFDSCTIQLGDISFYVPTSKDRETILERSVWRKVVGIGSDILELTSVPSAKSVNSIDVPENNNMEAEVTEEKTIHDFDSKEVEAGQKIGAKKKHFPRVSTKSLQKKKLKKAKPHPVVHFQPDSEVVVEAIHTSSFVDVVWQDGTIQEGVSSIDLYPIHHLDDHEFFPGDFVVRGESTELNLYGVIQNMNHSGRVALVQWFNAYSGVETNVSQQPQVLELEEMSVYDIRDHPEFRFRPGTIVIRIGNILPNECSAGQVVDNYPDGQVRVWWTTTGSTTSCWPQELYRLADYDSDEGEVWDDGDDAVASDSSWETDEEEAPPDLSSTPSNPAVGESTDITQNTPVIPFKDIISKDAIADASLPAKVPSDPYFSIVCAERFILVETIPEGHRYRSTSFQPQNARNFLKTVQKEVKLFRENLPPGIFVKGYEDRMDLYSVMICGPENTPYEDGLFLFDVQLPPMYPHSPPFVHYNSFCSDRLNPNLYECGKVCVSLLGTWSGKGSEVWNFNDSSLLQLLISIQGLILVSEPYYNEAGYEKQKGTEQGKENSRMYNEMVLIKLVQSMSRQLVNPPAPWSKEVKQHIYQHGPRLIKRCRKWLKLSEKPTVPAQPVTPTVNGTNNTGLVSKLLSFFNLKKLFVSKSSVVACKVEERHDDSVDLQVDGNDDENAKLPGFFLLPVSKGFSITFKKTLDNFAILCDPSIPSSNSTKAIDGRFSLMQLDSLD